MAHSRIWEIENSHCYYERGQLNNMILSWEPDIFDQNIQDFDHVLGIYTQNYFTKTRYGRLPFMMTPDETSISLMALKQNINNDNFAILHEDKLKIQYEFKAKLWKGDIKDLKMANISKMLSIDNAFINSKITSFQQTPQVTWRWPLAYTLYTEKVEDILGQYNITLSDQENSIVNENRS